MAAAAAHTLSSAEVDAVDLAVRRHRRQVDHPGREDHGQSRFAQETYQRP